MIDFNSINKIKTPEQWINQTLKSASETDVKKHKKFHCGIVTAAAIGLCVILSVGAAAATSGNFGTWIKRQLGLTHETQVRVYSIDLPKNIGLIENSFVVTDCDTKNEKAYCISGEKLVLCDKNSVSSSLNYNGKDYNFSFDYAKNGSLFYTYNLKGSLINVTQSNDENQLIVELKLGKIWNSYYFNLGTKELTSIVGEPNSKASRTTTLKYAVDVQLSPDGSYILYRSNKEASTIKGKDTEWFIRDTHTGTDIKLNNVSKYLRNSDICFFDDSHIYIAYKGDVEIPGIYDCKENKLKWFDNIKGTSCGDSMIYYNYKNGEYAFTNLINNKTYRIKADKTWVDCGMIVNQDVICLYNANDKLKVYLPQKDKALDFGKETFSAISSITDVYGCSVKDGQYLFIGQNANETVGYILETD